MNNTKSKNTYVAIMAGGIGSRFWPASRVDRPKQFLDILGTGQSLIRSTFERFLHICPVENIFILTNEAYKEQVKEHLPELSNEQILCEPSRNNTAPCIAYVAFKLFQLNPAANFIVAPSDHIILNEIAFLGSIEKGLIFTAQNEALLTLGIQPNRPDTGYGYIKYQKINPQEDTVVFKVEEFKEKPDLPTAQTYLESGDYVWNAGIFIWKASSIIQAFKKYNPVIYDIFQSISEQLNTSEEQAVINEKYPNCPSISIDYAIMENAHNIFTIPSEFGWSDLGTWASLYAESSKDNTENVLYGENIVTIDTKDCLIRVPNEKLVVLKDLDNYIVIDEADVLLIYPKNKEQEIKALTNQIAQQKGNHFL